MDAELNWEDMFMYRHRFLGLMMIPICKSIDAAQD